MSDIFDWKDFLSIAEKANEQVSNARTNSPLYQAWIRTGCSRAYYGAYQVARKKIIQRGDKLTLGDKSKGSHERVIEYFRGFPEIYDRLVDCQSARVESDYYESPSVRRIKLQQSIENARLIIQDLEKL